jgi:16S rRNA G966 N2-methylase RsmD
LINSNLAQLKDLEVSANIIRKDVIKFLKEVKGICFDLVFIDPPYKIKKEEISEVFFILSNRSGKIIHKDSIVIYEYFAKRDIKDEIGEMKIIKKSHFGDKTVSYIML